MAKSERKRIEIGFGGGQVVSVVTITGQLEALYKALEADDTAWFHLDTEEGTVILDLSEIVYVHTTTGSSAVGFSG